MNPAQLQLIQHCLGADKYGMPDHRYARGAGLAAYYRNHFCAGPSDEPTCRELIAMGYMVQHETTEWLPYLNCSVTEAGLKAMREASPKSPKVTRSQKRYQEFLNASDAFGCNFREFLQMQKEDWYKQMKGIA